MITVLSLWLPILVASVAVFFLSFLMWMVLPHHKSDWQGVPDEEALTGELRRQGVRTGQYMLPCGDKERMKDPEFMQRLQEGPSGMIVLRRGYSLGRNLFQSFVFNLVVSALVAYVATVALGRGSAAVDVLRLTATTAFLAYAGATAWGPIWWGRTWSSTFKEIVDGLAYGVSTGLVFMLLWP